jgi:pyruvate/2-oxoglutarate dehydrogenase complex dihydrolipoamide acyltransferase (E2) component
MPVAAGNDVSHASPAVRKYARELGVNVALVKGSGPKGRITQEDVQAFVKGVMSGATPTASQSNNQVTPGSVVAAQTPVSAAAPQDAAPIVIQVPVAAPVAAAPAPVVTVAPKTSSSN